METMQCKGCGEIKDISGFYFADGGLQQINEIAEIKCELCKDCVEDFNRHSTKGAKNNYLKWQFIACYFIAEQIFGDNSKNINQIIQNVENGYKKYGDNVKGKERKKTFKMAVENFLYLFGVRGLRNTNNKQQYVFNALNSAKDSIQIEIVVKEILEEDYETFRKFKEKCTN